MTGEPWSVSVVVLERELFPWRRQVNEPEDNAADRIRELADRLGVRVAVISGWRGHLVVSAAAAERLLAASSARQRTERAAADEAARASEALLVPGPAPELYRQGINAPQVDVARKKAALRLAGATDQMMANADARRGSNGL
jgi:sugar phosphate isomerase/epimerase